MQTPRQLQELIKISCPDWSFPKVPADTSLSAEFAGRLFKSVRARFVSKRHWCQSAIRCSGPVAGERNGLGVAEALDHIPMGHRRKSGLYVHVPDPRPAITHIAHSHPYV